MKVSHDIQSQSRRTTQYASCNALGGDMWGRRPERRHKCSLQRSLCSTCSTFIPCLMRSNARLIEYISIQILLGASASGDTVTTVFIDSPVLQFVLNYLCSTLQRRGRRLQTVPGIGLGCFLQSRRSLLASLTTLRSRRWHWLSTDALSRSLSVSPHWFYCCHYFFLHKPPGERQWEGKMKDTS